jgi:secondary thiamine-phosphate synthase enzyme
MRQSLHRLDVTTARRGFVDITGQVTSWLTSTPLTDGLLTLFIRHTSASLLIQENADPAVLRDLERALARIAPDGDPLFEHDSEGPDDMPAHVRSALTQTHLSIPFVNGALALGPWQAIYVVEHRRAGHRREVVLHALGQ